jgi:flagellar hook-associated protein 1 FlgK
MPANSSDNGNARELAALDGANVFNSGTQSLMGSVSQMTSSIGSTARQASMALDAQSALDEQLQLERESVSGVNLDEEAANLLKYQQAYQAAAQIIAIASENFQALLAAARS